MVRCWDKDPDRRPYFPEICERLNEIMLEAAIRDKHGFQFWKSVGLKKARSRPESIQVRSPLSI